VVPLVVPLVVSIAVPLVVSLVVGPDPLVTADATHISIATHSAWGTFLYGGSLRSGSRSGSVYMILIEEGYVQ